LFNIGSYILDGMSAQWKLSLTGAKTIKFFSILNQVFLGELTNNEMKIFEYNPVMSQFYHAQTIIVQNGISFTLLETNDLVYLVVLEKFSGHFDGVSSRMYMYDPVKLNGVFDIIHPTYFKVYEPSALTSFHVYGKPFMAIVNKRDKGMITRNYMNLPT